MCEFCHLHKAHKGCYTYIDEDIQLKLLLIAENKKALIKSKVREVNISLTFY